MMYANETQSIIKYFVTFKMNQNWIRHSIQIEHIKLLLFFWHLRLSNMNLSNKVYHKR